MTIGELKSAWRDLPDSTSVVILDPRGDLVETRDIASLDIERVLSSDDDGVPNGHEDGFNIRLEE